MSRTRVEPELNLVPIMNLVTILIPFLLMSAEFVGLAVVDVTARGAMPAIPSPAAREDFALTITVTDQALVLGGTNGALNDAGDVMLRVPCSGECRKSGYPLDELRDRLFEAKALHPTVDEMVLAAEDHVQTETLIAIMDAARAHPGHRTAGKSAVLYPAVTLASP